jgi:hypothetical protein
MTPKARRQLVDFAAKTLGVTIPPSLLLQADRVID